MVLPGPLINVSTLSSTLGYADSRKALMISATLGSSRISSRVSGSGSRQFGYSSIAPDPWPTT
ncbi:hypothetical protein [Mycobacterium nebraskense]|uniref:Uncharacterized protein n=1 Tax=Mycobacterium nebraskense TaxID=244292 RepID=A0A1X1ZQE8_9MYCO|nr:hypothetical protein [Mycobacterium nebraskense]KKC02377.1 hypothetical protein WU83_24520 [Mycobacterium nebraskense]MBI2696679.1 hypothetical protein [Mycobacterium nebraskense]MCV7117937.1 hypothetical protein [Mycobacterium nebraskense]ORW25624.1 hypothetical protein AWC17_01610 [Mycobacterium nebraskense]